MKSQPYSIAAYCIVILLAAISFAYAMVKPLNHNEHMYISAALLSQHNTIYTDFAFVQMPYLPLFYNVHYQLTATHHYLLWGRICSWAVTVATGVLLFILMRRRTPTRWLSFTILPLFLLNQVILDVQAESSNYAIPLGASVIAFACIVYAIQHPRLAPWLAASGGIALALATGTKLYYIVCFIPFTVVLVCYPREKSLRQRIVGYILPFFVGSAVGLLPVAWFWVRDPAAFWFNNIGFHTTNTLWRWSLGQTFAMTPGGKITFFLRLLFALPSNIIFLGLVPTCAIVVLTWQRHRRELLQHLPPSMVLALLLAFTTTTTLFTATPMVLQHASMPIPFVLFAFISSFSAPIVSIARRQRYALLLTGMLLATLGASGSTLLSHSPQLIQPAQWEVFNLHRTAQELQQFVPEGGTIATLSPLYALEANRTIYPELASGPFFYRVGDVLSEEQRQRFVGTSPNSICTLLKQMPPDAILVGFEDMPFLEEPLYTCAKDMGYTVIPDKLAGQGIVYTR